MPTRCPTFTGAASLYFKSILLVALVGGVVGILLFGPRKAANSVTVGDDVVVVDYWEKWTGNEGQQMQGIVDEFNWTVGASQKIYVRYVSTSQIAQKTLIATAAGVPPDIAGVWDNTMPPTGGDGRARAARRSGVGARHHVRNV